MSLSPARRRRLLAALACCFVFVTTNEVQAAEGMFLLDRLPEARLRASGLKIEPARLGQLSRAVVRVARGGTGSFVSKRGLLVTNHHVAYGCLTRLGAQQEHLGLLERGYYARTLEQELPCPGYDLLVVEQVRDITAEVLSAVKPRMHWSARFETIRLRKEELVEACEADGRHVCEAADLDGGTSYLLSVYRRVRDVRLVYAPPKALGKFGGDVDNWMYPRHTADFTFLRAYVDAKGAGASFARSNVPMSTPVHLALSRHGVRRGSLALVMGFPARTSRHVTSHSVRHYVEASLPPLIELLEGLQRVLDARMKASPDSRRKYASLDAGILNALKYYRMSRQGMARWKVLARKLEQERELAPKGSAAAALLARIDRVFARYRTYHLKLGILDRMVSWAVPSIRMAHDMARWGVEKAKNNRMRKDEQYKDKNVYRILEAAERLERETDLQTEKALLLHFLRSAEKLPPGQRPRSTASLVRWGRRSLAALRAAARRNREDLATHYKRTVGVDLARDPLQLAVDQMYGLSRLLAKNDDPKEVARAVALRARVLRMKSADISAFADPLLRFAREVAAERAALREGPHREVEQYLATVLHPQWVKESKRHYPDANATVRLSYGSVQDYTASATGVRHRYLTTLSGLLAKDRRKFPFRVPRSLRAAYPRRMQSPFVDRTVGDIPVNFTSTLDTTGGNSGSPVLDDRGRLVGLLFDGTPESILSDWQYLEHEQRSICMDIRLALYLAAVDRATRVLEELLPDRPAGARGAR